MRCFRHAQCGQDAEYKYRIDNVFYVACKACVLALKAKSSAQPTGN